MRQLCRPGQQFRDEEEDERADDRTPERAEAAQHDREQEEDREVGGEIIRRDDRLLYGKERAATPANAADITNATSFVMLRRCADGQRCRLDIPDRDECAAETRMDDIADEDEGDDGDNDHAVVERPRTEFEPKAEGGGTPTTPAKPLVSQRHSTIIFSKTSAKASVMKAKYQVLSRNAGSAASTPSPAASAIPTAAAAQNDQ